MQCFDNAFEQGFDETENLPVLAVCRTHNGPQCRADIIGQVQQPLACAVLRHGAVGVSVKFHAGQFFQHKAETVGVMKVRAFPLFAASRNQKLGRFQGVAARAVCQRVISARVELWQLIK